jgi:flagellar hook-length control protein FliK
MLTDLRRDLGAGTAGSATTLSLGTGDAPQQDGRGQQAASTWLGAGGGGTGGRAAAEDRPVRGASLRGADDTSTDRRILSPSSSSLDVLA